MISTKFKILILCALAFTLGACSSAKKVEDPCGHDAAFKAGLDDAQKGRHRSVDKVVEVCPVESRHLVEQGYREGFDSYDGIEADPNSKAERSEPVKCKTKADCGEGQWCRNRGDGVRLCLNNEPRGGYCEHDDDCRSGLCGRTEKKIGKCM